MPATSAGPSRTEPRAVLGAECSALSADAPQPFLWGPSYVAAWVGLTPSGEECRVRPLL